MTSAYWDAQAADYEANIVSVFDRDVHGLIRQRIIRAVSPEARAVDMGCGVGKFTALLAEHFSHVDACDFSASSLAIAREHCIRHDNIRFHQVDFTHDRMPFEPARLVICVNVLIMASLDARLRAWRSVTNQVAHEGTLVLVLPSHESFLFSHLAGIEAALDAGYDCDTAVRHTLPEDGAASDFHQGVHALEGVLTKHYLREEIGMLLDEHQFDRVEISKLPYDESEAVDSGSTDQVRNSPWLWLAAARRRPS